MKQPELGNLVKELRNKKGLTQEELALRCGLNISTVQKVEDGSMFPSSSIVKLLAEELEFEYTFESNDDSKFWLITLHLSNFFCIVVNPLLSCAKSEIFGK